MSDISVNHIDFEKWSTLASSDPEKFEQLRQEKISSFIESATQERQQRLQGLQWQIDRTRERHKGSTRASCLAISKLMWQTFEQLSAMIQAQATNKAVADEAVDAANVISFPKS